MTIHIRAQSEPVRDNRASWDEDLGKKCSRLQCSIWGWEGKGGGEVQVGLSARLRHWCRVPHARSREPFADIPV